MRRTWLIKECRLYFVELSEIFGNCRYKTRTREKLLSFITFEGFTVYMYIIT